MPCEIQFMTFDRADLEEISIIRESIKTNGFYYGRTDIGMINIWDDSTGKSKHVVQYTIEPTYSGVPSCPLFVASLLTVKEWAELVAINQRVLQAEKDYDLPKGTLIHL